MYSFYLTFDRGSKHNHPMRTLFIADAHLKSPDQPNYRQLLRFLHEQEGQLDTLYIMGDLFDFWVGFPSQPFHHYDPVLDALERLVIRGCRVVYFEGNHDFHLGPVFSHRLKARIERGPSIERVQGRQLYLCHGDQINPDDYLYRLLRFFLHSPVTATCVRLVSPTWAEWIRSRLQSHSQSGYESKTARWNYQKILFDFAHTLSESGCDGMVTGHFHLALHEKAPGTSVEIVALGDWMAQQTYGEMVDGVLSLKSYGAESAISEKTLPEPGLRPGTP